MTTNVAARRAAAAVRMAGYRAARRRFPPRPVQQDWPGTGQAREQVLGQLATAAAGNAAGQQAIAGIEALLDWLEDQEGGSWQERWLASGAESLGARWLQLPARWLHQRAGHPDRRAGMLPRALAATIGGDIVRPSLAWLVAARYDTGLARAMAACRDPAGFAQLAELGDRASGGVPKAARSHTVRRAAVIMAAKGVTLAGIEIGDLLELLDTEVAVLGAVRAGAAGCYRLLRQLGIFGPAAPMRLRELRTAGQRTPEEMIGRHNLACRPIRDLLVDYLKERQPAIDYASLEQLAHRLGMFWADLEAHHPGIDSLHLSNQVATAWKQRMRTKPKTITLPDGSKTVTETERICHREFLTPVRAFYLDLAQWAVEDPGRWARWAVPCPVGPADTIQGKVQRHRKSRMDARTRERLPVLPVLARCAAQQHTGAAALLHAARAASPGDILTAAGQTLARAATRGACATAWAEDLATGKRRNLTLEEDRAFWAWAAIEVLRATGIRIEELTELSHHSLVQYRLPATGELVPLLQIAPSKTDAERLLVISPELADVLATIISRIRGPGGTVPPVAAYDDHERIWLPPAPVLFQRRIGAENRAIPAATIRKLLAAALTRTGLTGPSGDPLHYTPHDFRRMFLTDAILGGLPPHIAQVIAGHRDINITLGYKAAYPDEAIQAHLAFLARRRALRPTEEYRTPTDAEWAEFLGHFERRKVATGLCGRAFATPCIHEHSCLRCALHWPDPAQRSRIAEIRGNLTARIAEAEREGWPGEAEGLKISLAGAEDKLAQIDRRSRRTIDLGMPATARKP
jgi:hypothetical protein